MLEEFDKEPSSRERQSYRLSASSMPDLPENWPSWMTLFILT